MSCHTHPISSLAHCYKLLRSLSTYSPLQHFILLKQHELYSLNLLTIIYLNCWKLLRISVTSSQLITFNIYSCKNNDLHFLFEIIEAEIISLICPKAQIVTNKGKMVM